MVGLEVNARPPIPQELVQVYINVQRGRGRAGALAKRVRQSLKRSLESGTYNHKEAIEKYWLPMVSLAAVEAEDEDAISTHRRPDLIKLANFFAQGFLKEHLNPILHPEIRSRIAESVESVPSSDTADVEYLSEKERAMKESSLRGRLIRLAHANPELRKDLLPLLAAGKKAKLARYVDRSIADLENVLVQLEPYNRTGLPEDKVRQIANNLKGIAADIRRLDTGTAKHLMAAAKALKIKPEPNVVRNVSDRLRRGILFLEGSPV